MSIAAGKLRISERFGPSRTLLLALVLTVSACGSSGGGDEVIVGGDTDPGGENPTIPPSSCMTYVVDKDSPDASDTNDGRYARDGGTGPWRTIQHAVDRVGPCDTIQVRRAATPYVESANGYGVVIGQSGEAGKPITLEGFPGERPVLDLQQDSTSQEHAGGIFLNCVSWLVLRNFEIRNAAEAGVSGSLTGCGSRDLIIEDLIIHDIYGGNMAAGIRLNGSSEARIRDNTIYRVFKVREDDGPAVVPGDRESRSIEIEGNSIYSVGSGVIFSLQSGASLVDASVHDNRVYDAVEGVELLADLAGGSFSSVAIYGNILHGLDRGLSADLSDSSALSTGLSFRNNTLFDVRGAVELDKMADVSIYNNIFSNVDREYLIASHAVVFNYFDNNIYWPLNSVGWTLRSVGGARTYTSFDEWRTAYSTEGQTALRENPDTQSLVVDPLFVDALLGDFRLGPNSPALGRGRNAESIGGYFEVAE